MKYFLIRSAIFVLLPVTMAWKMAVVPGDVGEIRERVVDFLTSQHFAVTAEEQIIGEMPILRASAGGCQLLVAKVSAVGSNRDVIRSLARPDDAVFTVFRGKVYSEQPTNLTVLTFLWSKVLSELGLMRHIVPVFAVVASPSCGATHLPWERLQDIGFS